ncbi:TPA: MFS transporter [Enterococcus faecium]|uniref:MFS transporter n=1 Tax=Enterococcus TaxID=1350 RepID=UPI0009376274|nr:MULTISPECIES: MFS transporter [Enterococcus]QUM63219.1 MFS transporter [Enterococcus faecium]
MCMNKKMMKFSLLSVSLILTSAGAVTSAIPSMSATYATRSLSAVELLTTAPSFMVTIFVLFSSFIARRIGQKQTVIIGLVIASICGVLSLFSQSYSIVLASRAGLGIGFGLINSLAVSMIAAFYHGDERASMIGFQSAFQGFGAALMTFVAGQLVQFGWQYTFLVYAISLPILILFVLFVPRPETTEIQVQGTASARQVIKTNPKMISISYGIFLLLIIVVYNAVSIKLATVLTTYSLGDETNAANILTIMQLASMAAGVCFGWLQAKAHRYMLTLSLLLMGIGFVLIASAMNLYVIGFGAILTGISFSLFIPYLFNQVSIQAPKHTESFNTSILLVGANLGTFIAPYGLLFLSFVSLGSKTLAVFVNGSTLLLISALVSVLVVYRTNRKTVIRVDEEIKEQLTTK